MNDCPNADVRDLLPDLLHDRLDKATRAMVESHVEGCADCRAELALLRDVRASLRYSPALNIAAITAAVPSYRAPVRRSWVGWRTAASVTLLLAGGSSLVVMQRVGSHSVDSAAVVAATDRAVLAEPQIAHGTESTTVAVAPQSVEPSAPRVARQPVAENPMPDVRVSDRRELALAGGSLTDLSERELSSLLKDIESLDALPSTDVESVSISPIAPSAPPRGRP
ncbi:MAG: zf-HC2 domain-containing protein [bacterium]